MFSWIKRNKYPDFWLDYVKEFKKRDKKPFKSLRFVVFDTETTGLNLAEDKVLSIGAVAVKNKVIDVADNFEIYIKQDKFEAQTVEIHGILKEGKIEKNAEEEAIRLFLNYIKDAVLVAHHAAFDIAMINAALKSLALPKLKNKVIDTGNIFKKTSMYNGKKKHVSLDELSDIFRIKKHDRHTAAGDAYITALLFVKILAEFRNKRALTLSYLVSTSERRGLM